MWFTYIRSQPASISSSFLLFVLLSSSFSDGLLVSTKEATFERDDFMAGFGFFFFLHSQKVVLNSMIIYLVGF